MADPKEKYFNIDTDEVVCPYCGAEVMDSWELPDCDDIECWECGKKFHYEREVTVTYWSHRIKDDGKVDYKDELMEQ